MFSNRKKSKITRLVIPALLVAALLAGVAAVNVLAVDIGGYKIDKVVPDVDDNGDPIPGEFVDLYGSVDELGPVNSNETKLGAIHTAPLPMLSTTNPNAQVDLRRIWLDSNVDEYGDIWLYFAWERDSSNGSGVIMYEFQQNPAPDGCNYAAIDPLTCNPWANRSPDDFIIVWDQAGKKINLIKRTFYLDGGVLKLDAGVNLTELPADEHGRTVAAADYSTDKYSGEAAINLTETVFGDPTSCFSIANIIPGTVTGNSDTADYKDTVLADYTEDIAISNCGEIQVTKIVDSWYNETTFSYTIDRGGDEQIKYDGTTEIKDALPNLVEPVEWTESWEDLIAGENYQLVEGDVGPAYEMTSIVCQVDEDENAVFDITDGGTFPVEPSTITYCEITNELQQGTLIVKKLVINDEGGSKVATDFSFSVDSGEAVPFITDPDLDPQDLLKGKNTLTVDSGTYDVTEPAVTGYTTSYDNCEDVVVSPGGSATCTITNDDIGPTLKLVKEVDTGDGGNEGPSVWTLCADADAPDDGRNFCNAGGSGVFEDVYANVGYDLSESDVSGYTPQGWECDGGTLVDSTVTLSEGETGVTCTITNDDIAPRLTLVKEVTNDNGLTHQASEWTLTATGVGGISGQGTQDPNPANNRAVFGPRNVRANVTYALSENGPDGYTAGNWSCVGGTAGTNTITLNEGGSATCTIINNDRKAQPDGATDMSWVLHDSLTITGIRPGATGATVTFKLFGNSACSGDALLTETDNTIVSGQAATTTGYTTSTQDTYYWQVTYSGDPNNEGFVTRCGYEVTEVKETVSGSFLDHRTP